MNTHTYITIVAGILLVFQVIIYLKLKRQIEYNNPHIQILNIRSKMPGILSVRDIVDVLIEANHHDVYLVRKMLLAKSLYHFSCSLPAKDRTIILKGQREDKMFYYIEIKLSCPETFDFISEKLNHSGHGYYAGNFLIESWKEKLSDSGHG